MNQIYVSSQAEAGAGSSAGWVVTAPFDQQLLPALVFIEGVPGWGNLVWLPLVALVLVVAGSSPFMRDWRSALILCSSAFGTGVVLWIDRAYVIPRYFSFLLVPLFMLLATGAAHVLGRLPRRPALVRTVICIVVIGVL